MQCAYFLEFYVAPGMQNEKGDFFAPDHSMKVQSNETLMVMCSRKVCQICEKDPCNSGVTRSVSNQR